ncbi:MAG: dephospho-CoA kinase [Bryobacteraceae bacterium]
MIRVGLTGGLATGKTHIGRELDRLGCYVVRADELGHAVLAPDGEAFEGVVAEFGRGILNEDGSIDRRKLAAQVFDNPERLAALNRLVHPPVERRERALMNAFAAREPDGIGVIEAAILVETGSYRKFDRLIVAVCGEDQQLERAMQRDGLTREEALARLRRQMPLAEKARLADFVIDTSGSMEDTLRQTRSVYEELRRIAS